MKRTEILMVIGLMFTLGAAIGGIALYTAGAYMDRNLAYMGLYYDGAAIDLYRTNASNDAVLLASGTAWRFCELYRIERRTIEDRYAGLCEAVQERHVLLVMCLNNPDSDVCSDDNIYKLQAKVAAVEDLGRDLYESPPYFGFVFSDDYRPQVCFLGGEEVPCPGED